MTTRCAWDAASGARLTALAVLPDGKLASGSSANTVRVWDAASGADLLTLAGHTKNWVTALALMTTRAGE